MIIKDYDEGKIILLSKALDSKSKVLNFIYFFFFIALTLCFGLMSTTFDFSFAALIFTIFFVAICSIASYRFLDKAFQKEKLFVTRTNITIIKSGIFFKKEKTYTNGLISQFRHLGKPKLTRHPLAGESLDYLSFQTEQAVINDLHGDNRLAFAYKETTITFGENIYTWEFEELQRILCDITGNDFRYNDDFDKPNDGHPQPT